MDNQVFISYKRMDKDKVFPIKDFLEKKTGLKFWIDLDGIESDAAFKQVIINAIKKSSVFLFFYSKQHLKIENYEKDWTMKELNYAARDDNRRIVFINIDGTPLTDTLEFDFGGKQQVDARDPSRLDKLACDLNLWLKNNRNKDIPKELIKSAPQPKEAKDEIQKPVDQSNKTIVNDNATCKIEDTRFNDASSKDNKKDNKKDKRGKTDSCVTDKSQRGLKEDLKSSLVFENGDSKFYMVLSDDKSFYIGNINAKKNDFSWIKNDITVSMGAAYLCATALPLTISAPLFLILGGIYAGVKSVLGFGQKKTNHVDAELCQKLYKSTGYKFRVPTIDQLNGVEEKARNSCIILSCEDNPTLFHQESQQIKTDNTEGLSLEDIKKQFGDIFGSNH